MQIELSDAVAAWIRAEWFFRHGPYAYRTPATTSYVGATEALRKALTGRKGLGAAFSVLKGGKVAPAPGKRLKRARIKRSKS